ncbi:unnamed protein product [Prorocentrum cordatum]|uniref:Uncharacterized protein n=1 Tax=Prorocentrum cordatum TaxID=2364126 RepID=A0ABN9PIH7_9DINO|nr:unnamed protein product [Polarella glacialis]
MAAQTAVDLGCDAAAGRRRSCRKICARFRSGRLRASKIKRARQRAALGLAAKGLQGLAPSRLQGPGRQAGATAGGQVGGRRLTAVLVATVGEDLGIGLRLQLLDSLLTLQETVPELHERIKRARGRVRQVLVAAGSRHWRRARGPLGAAQATTTDMGWEPTSAGYWIRSGHQGDWSVQATRASGAPYTEWPLAQAGDEASGSFVDHKVLLHDAEDDMQHQAYPEALATPRAADGALADQELNFGMGALGGSRAEGRVTVFGDKSGGTHSGGPEAAALRSSGSDHAVAHTKLALALQNGTEGRGLDFDRLPPHAECDGALLGTEREAFLAAGNANADTGAERAVEWASEVGTVHAAEHGLCYPVPGANAAKAASESTGWFLAQEEGAVQQAAAGCELKAGGGAYPAGSATATADETALRAIGVYALVKVRNAWQYGFPGGDCAAAFRRHIRAAVVGGALPSPAGAGLFSASASGFPFSAHLAVGQALPDILGVGCPPPPGCWPPPPDPAGPWACGAGAPPWLLAQGPAGGALQPPQQLLLQNGWPPGIATVPNPSSVARSPGRRHRRDECCGLPRRQGAGRGGQEEKEAAPPAAAGGPWLLPLPAAPPPRPPPPGFYTSQRLLLEQRLATAPQAPLDEFFWSMRMAQQASLSQSGRDAEGRQGGRATRGRPCC